MTRRTWAWLAAAAAAMALGLAACGGDDESAATTGESQAKDKVTVQLKWVTQAQFAGYYAAVEKGYYGDEGLDVTIKVGGPDITPEQVVASGQAEFGLDRLPSLLATRDKGSDLVNIAQVFGKSGMLEVTHKDSGITDIAGMRGKKVGVWCCGNENELYAALTKNNIDLKKDVTIVNQPFDMGWAFCRDNQEECLQIVLDNGPTLGEGHQKWQLNEINALIWPTGAAGIGVMDESAFQRTADIAEQFKVVSKPATKDAYRTDLAEAAVTELKDEGVDVNGDSWQKATVEVTEGGK